MSNELRQEQYDGSEMQNPVPFTDFLGGGNEIGIEPVEHGKQIMGIVEQVEKEAPAGELVNFVNFKKKKEEEGKGLDTETVKTDLLNFVERVNGEEIEEENLTANIKKVLLEQSEHTGNQKRIGSLINYINHLESDLFEHIPNEVVRTMFVDELVDILLEDRRLYNLLKTSNGIERVLVEDIVDALFERNFRGTLRDRSEHYFNISRKEFVKGIYG